MTIKKANRIFKDANGEEATKYIFVGFRTAISGYGEFKERIYCDPADYGYLDYNRNCYNMEELFAREGLNFFDFC